LAAVTLIISVLGRLLKRLGREALFNQGPLGANTNPNANANPNANVNPNTNLVLTLGSKLSYAEWLAFLSFQRSSVLSEFESLLTGSDEVQLSSSTASVQMPIDATRPVDYRELFNSTAAMTLGISGGEVLKIDQKGITAIFPTPATLQGEAPQYGRAAREAPQKL